MGRRRQKNTVDSIHRKAAQGRGRGTGQSYKPGIYTYEIPSKGKVARVRGMTTNRVHHCLSQPEKCFLILLDADPSVTEILEQYSLDMKDTLLICAENGLKHPYADQCPTVMTTDFYYCSDGQWFAVAIKTTEDLKKPRTREKLEIERLYWEKRGISWRIVTEQDIPIQKVINLQWLYSGEPIENLVPDQDYRNRLKESFFELYQDDTIPFVEIIETIESYCQLPCGTMIQLFKDLILEGTVSIDLMEPIDMMEPRCPKAYAQLDRRHDGRS